MLQPPFEPSHPDFPSTAVDKRRLVFLLRQIGTKFVTISDIEDKYSPDKAKVMGFSKDSISAIVVDLVKRGWLKNKAKQSQEIALSESGKKLLKDLKVYQLPDHFELLEIPSDERNLREMRYASVLFHLFRAKEKTQTNSEANKTIPAQDYLRLNAARAELIRQELCEAGLIRWQPTQKSIRLILTDLGLAHLKTLPFAPNTEFKLKGDKLTELLSAKPREAAEFKPVVDTESPVQAPKTVAELRQVVMNCFDQLIREKYFRTGMVPIHEVRSEIAKRFGTQSASHDVLDPIIKQLRLDGIYNLVAISMDDSVTREQMRDSIQGANETLFFLERVAR